MKRSVMLEKIHDKLIDQPMTDDWPNQILSAMETLGMRPPKHYDEIDESYSDDWGSEESE